MRKKGSNQFQDKWGLSNASKKSLFHIFLVGAIVAFMGGWAQLEIKQLEARAQIVSPLAVTPARVLAYEEPPLASEELEKNLTLQEKIDKHIHVIFGKNARIAKAVQRAECNPKNKRYPVCVADTSKEYSVGVFQINLKAHADKVPGNTFAEKVAYLKNPFNNVLVAKSIFADSGWNPWSVYANGRYLSQL